MYRVVKQNFQVVRFRDFEHMRARMAKNFCTTSRHNIYLLIQSKKMRSKAKTSPESQKNPCRKFTQLFWELSRPMMPLVSGEGSCEADDASEVGDTSEAGDNSLCQGVDPTSPGFRVVAL